MAYKKQQGIIWPSEGSSSWDGWNGQDISLEWRKTDLRRESSLVIQEVQGEEDDQRSHGRTEWMMTVSRAVQSAHKSSDSDSSIFKTSRLRLLHKSWISINSGKPIRRFITTTWIIRLLFRLITYI
jgi:hypothetical protein